MAENSPRDVADAYSRVRATRAIGAENIHMNAGRVCLLAAYAAGVPAAMSYSSYTDFNGNTVAGGTIPANNAWGGVVIASTSGFDVNPAVDNSTIIFAID